MSRSEDNCCPKKACSTVAWSHQSRKKSVLITTDISYLTQPRIRIIYLHLTFVRHHWWRQCGLMRDTKTAFSIAIMSDTFKTFFAQYVFPSHLTHFANLLSTAANSYHFETLNQSRRSRSSFRIYSVLQGNCLDACWSTRHNKQSYFAPIHFTCRHKLPSKLMMLQNHAMK